MLIPFVPRRPLSNTRSAVFLEPKSGSICMSPSFCAISDTTVAVVAASVMMQNVPIGRTRDIQREIHNFKSAL